MTEETKSPTRLGGSREYLWFALTLLVLLACTVVAETDHLGAQSTLQSR